MIIFNDLQRIYVVLQTVSRSGFSECIVACIKIQTNETEGMYYSILFCSEWIWDLSFEKNGRVENSFGHVRKFAFLDFFFFLEAEVSICNIFFLFSVALVT